MADFIVVLVNVYVSHLLSNVQEFESEVARKLADGYVLAGGMVAVGVYWAQPMRKAHATNEDFKGRLTALTIAAGNYAQREMEWRKLTNTKQCMAAEMEVENARRWLVKVLEAERGMV